MGPERGLDKQDLPSQCLKLGEEVGELYRAVRNRCGINLEAAFRTKEARNETRIWV
jgi:hypothetical protein